MCPILGPLVPLFWISGGFRLIHFFAEANVMYIPRDPPLVLHMPTIVAGNFATMHQPRWDLAQIQMGNHPDRRRMRYRIAG